MTAVEWLMSQLPLGFKMTIAEKLEEAREMEKQQMKEMYLRGIENYDPTFKRKGSDVAKRLKEEMPEHVAQKADEYAERLVESSKQEQKRLITEIMNEDAKDGLYQQPTISDEEIEQFIQEQNIVGDEMIGVYIGIKWYREQLKSKQ